MLELQIVSKCFIVYLPFLALNIFLFGLFMIGGDTLYVSCFTLFIDLYL